MAGASRAGRIALAAALGLSAGSCGVDSLRETERVDATVDRSESAEAMILDLRLPGSVRPGEPVPMTLTVENTAEETAPLGLTGRPIAFDLTVTTPDGAEVWSRLHGRTVPMILQMALLEPGQHLEFSDAWDQRDNHGRPVDPGVYLVRGVLPTEDGKITTAARELRIAP